MTDFASVIRQRQRERKEAQNKYPIERIWKRLGVRPMNSEEVREAKASALPVGVRSMFRHPYLYLFTRALGFSVSVVMLVAGAGLAFWLWFFGAPLSIFLWTGSVFVAASAFYYSIFRLCNKIEYVSESVGCPVKRPTKVLSLLKKIDELKEEVPYDISTNFRCWGPVWFLVLTIDGKGCYLSSWNNGTL